MHWLLGQPIAVIVPVILGSYYLLALVAIGLVAVLKRFGWSAGFKEIFPHTIGPIGALFALLTAFLTAEVWPEYDRAREAVHQEATSLADLLVMTESSPPKLRESIRAEVRRHIDWTVSNEWPAMATRSAQVLPEEPLAGTLLNMLGSDEARAALDSNVRGALLHDVEKALDARRERIFLSKQSLRDVKVVVVVLLAFVELLLLAMLHANRKSAQRITVFAFASVAALSFFVIVIYDEPFAAGGVNVSPTPLLEIRPS
jgi:hypothetical protein